MNYVYEFMSLYRSLNYACDDTFMTRRFFFFFFLVERDFSGFLFLDSSSGFLSSFGAD